MYCIYYQAHVSKKETWYLVALLRSFEHLVFDRTYDKQANIFEFFVPANNERYFLELMKYFEQNGIISQLTKTSNRLLNPDETV